jgi:antitoxin PrlF
MMTATLTSKGQITIPKEIRDQLKLETGNQIEFDVDESGRVYLAPKNRDIWSLKGLLKAYKRDQPVSVEQMNTVIRRHRRKSK